MSMLKVLFLAAAPAKASARALDEEIRAIDAKIRAAEHRDRLVMIPHWDVQLDDLAGLLLRHMPHVIHLTGEAAASDGESPAVPRHVTPEALARVLGVLKDNVQVVLINASHSSAQARATAGAIDCAIGMAGSIGDEHAIPFAAEFYQTLAYGRSIQQAFDLGIVRLQNEGCEAAKDLVRLHCRSGLDPAGLVLITGSAKQPPPKARLESWLPDLPTHHLPREEEVARVKQALLGTGSQAVAITAPQKAAQPKAALAVRGMGGAGKSVLANAIARDLDVRNHFRDGLFWITVGQEGAGTESKAKLLQTSLAKRLGETLDADSVHEGKQRLRMLFADRCCLIILDDVWEPLDAQRLDVVEAGSRSRIMITTREGRVATQIDAQEIRLDKLSPEQAIRLLSDWYGRPVDEDAEARKVAKECGFLPLALAVCGAMAREGASWADIAAGLEQADLSFLDTTGLDPVFQSVLKSIDASVKRLEANQPELAGRYRDLAVFPSDEAVPESVVALLWAQGSNTTRHPAGLDLSALERQSLLTVGGDAPNRRVALHDLQQDYVSETHPDLKGAHRRLVEAYRARCSGVWANQENDGYFFQHLVDHLRMTGLQGDLVEARTLLLDGPWLQAKLDAVGILPLITDYRHFIEEEPFRLVRWALRLSAAHLSRDPSLLRGQIHGRLLGIGLPDIAHLLGSTQDQPPWLRPLTPNLYRPKEGLLQSLEGHAGPVLGLAITVDGRIAVSASHDHTLKVWDLEAGREIAALSGHEDAVSAVALTSDGRIAVSGSSDSTLKAWSVEDRKEIGTLRGHDGWVLAVALSPDGRFAVSGSDDATVRFWDVVDCRVLLTLRGHAEAVLGVALTPDGRRAVSSSYDRTLRVWDLEAGVEIGTLTGHAEAVVGVALTPDGRRAVSSSYDRTLKVWDLEHKKELVTLRGHTDAVLAVALTPDGRRAVSASSDRTMKVWDAESGKEIGTFRGHADTVRSVALTPDARRAVSASSDRTMKVWDAEAGAQTGTELGHTDHVLAVALSPDARWAVSASRDRTIKVWDAVAGKEIGILTGHDNAVNSATVATDCDRIVSASFDDKLKVWDLQTCHEIGELKGHLDAVLAVAMTNDGRRAVSGSRDRTLKIWDLDSGTAVGTLSGHANAINSVGLTCNGRIAVSASDDSTLKIWDLEVKQEIGTLIGHADAVGAVAVTPDGRIAVSASDDYTVKVWDLEARRAMNTIRGHSSEVRAVAITPDGRFAISASDRTLKLWDLASATVVAAFAADYPIFCCSLSQDGSSIVAGDSGGRVHFLRWEGA